MSGSGRVTPDGPVGGGLARWWVEHPGAGWAALLATLACGFLALLQLPRQEDPALPGRIARIELHVDGAEERADFRARSAIVSLRHSAVPPRRHSAPWPSRVGSVHRQT
jgi:hypothetical protein